MSRILGPVFRLLTAIVAVAVIYGLFGAPSLFSQQPDQIFEGLVTQCACSGSDGQAATSGDRTMPPCASACANAGPRYVLADSTYKVNFQFDKQDYPKLFAGKYVFVIGTLDRESGTIHVHNVVPDVPPQIRRAKSVAIVCDACPRGMAKARKAALEELSVWKRYTVVPDPKRADLIFLFSANRYLGDYLTRDSPDLRPVHVAITYMNVVDPRTGENLWGDSERLGSWMVSTATKDLIDELREILEVDQNPAERHAFLERHRIFKTATDVGK
jgi:hypothetical protein